ncbi:MAG: HupE/UreJ family protein [Methylophaga sp.]|nr:HupE/UreJ family protein [Methylophaga sp.]
MKKIILALSTLLALPAVAMAHPGHDIANFASGFSHPLTGIDHLLVMLAVGFWAGRSQSVGRWQMPMLFIVFMLFGVGLGSVMPVMAFTEVAIAVSLLALGLVILLSFSVNQLWQLCLTGVFALLHGLVHGQELVAQGSGMASVLGLLSATSILLGFGLFLASFKNQIGPFLNRGMGSLLTLSGAYLLFL